MLERIKGEQITFSSLIGSAIYSLTSANVYMYVHTHNTRAVQYYVYNNMCSIIWSIMLLSYLLLTLTNGGRMTASGWIRSILWFSLVNICPSLSLIFVKIILQNYIQIIRESLNLTTIYIYRFSADSEFWNTDISTICIKINLYFANEGPNEKECLLKYLKI